MEKQNKKLFDLFKVAQLTRSQPQYGYILAGLKRGELSYLAEHHYLVTFIAWRLALSCEKAGAKIDVRKVMELSMIHDFGELLGGDIAMPYARRNPKAKELSRKFEEQNMEFLAQYFEGDIMPAWHDAVAPKSDEALIAKMADLLETSCFKHFNSSFDKIDVILVKERLLKTAKMIKDKKAKVIISALAVDFQKSFQKGTARTIISGIE